MKLLKITLLFCCFAFPAVSDAPLVVEMVEATPISEIRVISQTGEIVARNRLNIAFASAGRVASVEVDEGDFVPKGATLARMESVQQEQDLRAAEAGVSTADADFRQAQDDYDRQQALLERGATTRSARDLAEDSLRIAEGTLAQAKSELDRARKALSDTVLLAPADSTVIDRMIEQGQVVGAAQPVIELALGRDIDAVFEISEDRFTASSEVSEISLTAIDPPTRTFTGQVREISPLVNERTGTVTVKVGVEGFPEGITFGDAVRGTATQREKPHVILPWTAMTANSRGPAVWVVDPQSMTVSIRNISVDRYETGRIILSGGLEPGTLVVTKGSQLLYPGRQVQRAEEAK
jgi:RND family efflux transporter MFP subunit